MGKKTYKGNTKQPATTQTTKIQAWRFNEDN